MNTNEHELKTEPIGRLAMAGCAPHLANRRFLVCQDGAHGVTRPTSVTQFVFIGVHSFKV
jgi:hypothetical protein